MKFRIAKKVALGMLSGQRRWRRSTVAEAWELIGHLGMVKAVVYRRGVRVYFCPRVHRMVAEEWRGVELDGWPVDS